MGNMPHQSPKLTFEDATEIWKLRAEGLFQHQIAAQFDVNPGRINEILKERKHPGSRHAAGMGSVL